jgi:undecaprenyl-diphosphatase
MNALLSYVYESDFRVDGMLRSWIPPRWFRLWMRWVSRLADGWLWLILAAVLAAGGDPTWKAMAAGSVAAAVTNLLLVLLKHRFRRPRPCDIEPHPLFADVKPPDPFSFPSGHSMNAFAVGTVLALHFPLVAPLALVLAGSIAVSRVVLGMHYVSDVMAGSAIGTFVGATTYVLLLGWHA